jgi:hypothetical protein
MAGAWHKVAFKRMGENLVARFMQPSSLSAQMPKLSVICVFEYILVD